MQTGLNLSLAEMDVSFIFGSWDGSPIDTWFGMDQINHALSIKSSENSQVREFSSYGDTVSVFELWIGDNLR